MSLYIVSWGQAGIVKAAKIVTFDIFKMDLRVPSLIKFSGN
jgi:hypothetical protein